MMPPQLTPTNWIAIGVIIITVINIAGWFVVHSRAKKREKIAAKEGRKRFFLAFLAAIKEEIDSQEHRAEPKTIFPRFTAIKSELRREAAMVEGDLATEEHRRKFRQLIDASVHLSDNQAGTSDGIKHILDVIGETERFMKST